MFQPVSATLKSSIRLSRAVPGARTMASSSRVPVIKTLAELRAWRREKRDRKQEVGVVPTMGALHQGHLDLVKRSLDTHPFTVMTLFVNPMQFAPTEDLSRYPRTLQRDLEQLSTLLPRNKASQVEEAESPKSTTSDSDPARQEGTLPLEAALAQDSVAPTDESPLVVFAPATDEMYPMRGELQDLRNHRGVGVEMRGLGDVMEGASRPQFFKGVATVCTKLFNAVEPDHAYFGQKDIQQALLLKLMVSDLLLSHPTPENLHILPTTRDPQTHLALSSRNAYLTPAEMEGAPVVYRALSAGKKVWQEATRETTGEEIVQAAERTVEEEIDRVKRSGDDVQVKLDYFEVFDKHTFEPVRGPLRMDTEEGKKRELVIAGAVWVGKTRLIDNVLLGWEVD